MTMNADGTPIVDAAGATGEGGDPPAPTIDELINWDEATKGPPPIESLSLADARTYFEAKKGEIVEQVKGDLTAAQQQAEAQRRAADERNANAKTDMDWAADVELRLKSTDEAVRAQAVEDSSGEHRARYLRGLALAFERDSTQHTQEVLSDYLAPMWNDVREKGHGKLIDEVFKDSARMSKYAMPDGKVNWVAAALDYADEIGYERGKNEKANEDEQNGRIADAANGAPALGAGSPGGTPKLFDGIDTKQPGAYRLMQQRIADSKKTAAGR